MFEPGIFSLQDIMGVAQKLIRAFPEKRIFAFYGDMGAGKTTMIQAICRILGTNDHVTSPTFALVNEYDSDTGMEIFHFDFYRIKSVTEAFDMGYEDYFYSGNFCFIEWPEKVEHLLPPGTVKVEIDVLADGKRSINATII